MLWVKRSPMFFNPFGNFLMFSDIVSHWDYTQTLLNTFSYVFHAVPYVFRNFLTCFKKCLTDFNFFYSFFLPTRVFSAFLANPPRPGGQVLGFILSVYKTAEADPRVQAMLYTLAISSCVCVCCQRVTHIIS